MMLMMRLPVYFLISATCLTGVFGCGSSGKNSDDRGGEIVVEYVAEDQPEPLDVDRFFSEITIVPLETVDESLISDILAVELIDSLVFVRDDHRLLLFDTRGKFISEIGQKGRGPGEYIGLQAFFVDRHNRTVTIIDYMKRLLLTYGFDGRFLSSTEIPAEWFDWCYHATLLDDNNILVFNKYNREHNMAYTLMNIGDLDRSEHFLSYDPVRIENYLYQFARHPMTRSGRGVHLTMPFDHTVYEYSDEQLTKKYYIETLGEMIPKERFQQAEGSYRSKILTFVNRNNYFGGFTDIFETDRSIFMHYWAKRAYPGLYVMDKSRNTGAYFTFPDGVNVLRTPIFPFYASDGNTFVSVLNMDKILMLQGFMRDDVRADEIDPELGMILKNMEETDNPLLIFYEMKP